MFNFIIKSSLKYRKAMLIMYLIIGIVGVFAFKNIPVDVLPDLNRPRVTIFAEAEGLGSQEVEQVVAMPLERIFATIPGVQAVRSSSALGLSVINVEFDRGTKSNINRQQVYERIQSVGLPEGVHTTVAPESALLGEVMRIGLTSSNSSIAQAELRGIAESSIRQTLTNIPGISNLLIMGGTPKQYNILLDPAKMVSHNISNDQIVTATKNITSPAGGGIVLQATIEYPVSIKPINSTVKELGGLVIVKNKEGNVLLSDIAKITEGSNAQRRGDALVNGEPGVIIRITKTQNANTVILTQQIEAQLDSIKSTLPTGVTLHKELFRQSNFIEKGLENVQGSLKEAMVIVAIVIALFLMNIRTTIIVMLSLPITFLLTAIIFNMFGVGINIMILGGLTIAIGELVDDSIVDMENIFRRLKENYLRPKSQQKSLWNVIYHASQEVRGSVIFATILQMIVFIPFLMLPGIDGKLLAPIGLSYLISLFVSLIVALTFVPAICSYILPSWIQTKYLKKYPELEHDLQSGESIDEREYKIHSIIEKEEDTWFTKKIKSRSLYPIKRSLANPRKALLFALMSLPISILLYINTPKEGLPSFNETSFTVGVTTKPGSSLEYTKNITEQLSKKIKSISGIKSTATIIGRADADAHAQGSNNGEMEIELGIDINNVNKERIYSELNTIISEFKKYAVISIGQPITHRVEELISGIRAPLVIKLYGQDLDQNEELGKEIVKRIEKIPGVLNPSLEPQTKVPNISATPNTINQSAYGISQNTVKEVLEMGIGGKQVSQVINGQLRYPVVMSYDLPWKGSIQALGSIPLLSDNGQQITLGTVTTLEESKSRNMINHENGQRRIVIQGFTQNRGIVDVVNDIKISLADLELPQGSYISYEGLYQAQKNSSTLLAIVMIFVLIGVCLVLYLHFQSRNTVGQLLLGIFTGWLGGMIGVYISGGVLSTAHLVGFISLMGIVARNGIMLIDHYKHLHLVEGLPWNQKTLIKGSLERVIPVAMTALSAILGLLPLVIYAKNTGNEILSPIATVIFRGLFASTVIELFIRPGVFFYFNKILHIKKISNKEITFD